MLTLDHDQASAVSQPLTRKHSVSKLLESTRYTIEWSVPVKGAIWSERHNISIAVRMATTEDVFDYIIPVPHPSSRIVLAPPRQSDGPYVLAALNDKRVYMNLIGPPYPYTDDDWD